jgi:cobyrinic acid a,c-diamide synthase
MMAVSESISDKDGHTWPMAGLLPGQVRMQGRLAGLTVKPPSGAKGEAVYRSGSLTASYFYNFFPSNPAAAASLLGWRS